MARRKKNSGGQALVMLSLSLMAMAGLMGLAVDLGWAFFVQQQAQSAADGAARAAVQEAYNYFAQTGDFSNIGTTCGTVSQCETTTATCPSAPGNLLASCLYASRDGFTGATGTNQQVTVQAAASSGTGNISIPGTTGTYNAQNVDYWVRVVAVQTVPQIFSALQGNVNAVVAASSVAAITGNANPASLVLLDQPNDCYASGGNDFFGRHGRGLVCGEDINISYCNGCGINAYGPIYMASTCSGQGGGYGYGGGGFGGGYGYGGGGTGFGCGDTVGGKGGNYAGNAGGGGFEGFFSNSVKSYGPNGVGTGSIQVQTPGAVTPVNSWTPRVQQLSAASVFLDPTQGEAQPPITAPGVVATCAVLNGVLDAYQWASDQQHLTVGPYSYYAYSGLDMTTGQPIPTGDPIRANGTITFSSSGICPSAVPVNTTNATVQTNSTFPTYIFYGGMALDTAENGFYGFYHHFGYDFKANFGPGQYVMVGTHTDPNYQYYFYDQNCQASVFCIDNQFGTVTGDSNSGTIFIFTSPNSTSIGVGGAKGVNAYYPGLQAQITAAGRPEINNPISSKIPGVVALAPNEGNVNINQVFASSTFTGITNVSALSQYNGIAFWQDRANSTLQYDSTGHVQYDSSGSAYANPNPPPYAANGMSIIGFFSGVSVNGVIYQPRGAYITDFGFNFSSYGFSSGLNVKAEIITGAVYLSGFGTQITLGTPTRRLVSYKTSMLQ